MRIRMQFMTRSLWRWMAAVTCFAIVHSSAAAAVDALPKDNPIAAFYAQNPQAAPGWVGKLPWTQVLAVTAFPGADDDARLAAAQAFLGGKGGVIHFPPGVYRFKNHFDLQNGVILRGAAPAIASAKDENYTLPTRFEFPKYQPSMQGDGTPIDTAFKSIRVADAAKVSNCGVANIAINRGHIYFAEAEDHNTGVNRFVFGCLLTNTAAADPTVPNKAYSHQPHQRWTHRHRAAIDIHCGENLFIANNRIPKSGDDNFIVKPYTLIKVRGTGQDFNIAQPKKKYDVFTLEEGVEFDYDNRPGIYANLFGITTGGARLDATPEKEQPWCFRKGIIIRDNYIYCSGRSAITFCGDGVYAGRNVIRFPAGLWRPTTTGLVISDGSATNDNRAITMRGYRWTAEGNDYEVHSNMAHERAIKINDGEGIMHEAYHNSAVRDSKMLNNVGNRYLCLWTTEIDGLLVQGNKVCAKGAAIHVLGKGKTIRNVKIIGNELSAGGINVSAGQPENIHIRKNGFTGLGNASITVDQLDWATDNRGFATELPKAKPPKGN